MRRLRYEHRIGGREFTRTRVRIQMREQMDLVLLCLHVQDGTF